MSPSNPHPTGSKGHHEYIPPQAAKNGMAAVPSGGYVEKEYEHQEYPKHVGKQGKIARNRTDEQAILASEAPSEAPKPESEE